MSKPKALIAWSSGKDSAWALHEVRRAGEYDVVGALTTVTETFQRVSMHGVREEILRAQHDAVGLPSVIVPIPYPCPNDIYEARMAAALDDAKRRDVTHVIFGDLFLEDVRAYREQKLAGTGITPLFPLWQRPTQALAREMIEAGIETYLVCVDLKQLPKAFAGRRFDHTYQSCRSRNQGWAVDVWLTTRSISTRMPRLSALRMNSTKSPPEPKRGSTP